MRKLTPEEALVHEIRVNRVSMGLTQYEAAEELGMSPTWFSQLLRYPMSIRMDTMREIVNLLGISPGTLLRVFYNDREIKKFKEE